MSLPERRPFVLLIGILLASLWLAACSGTPTETHVETVYMASSPAQLDTLSALMQAYNLEAGVQPWQLDITSSQNARLGLEEGSYTLIFSVLDPQSGWFATPVLDDAIVLIVHPDNPLRDIPISVLPDIFTGRILSWNELTENTAADEIPIKPVVLQRGSELRLLMDRLMMGQEKPAAWAIAAPTPAEVKTYISNHPGAIGYLPFSQIDEESDRVRICRIDGTRPAETTIADGSYPFTYQLLALALTEPQGLLRDWLTWMQEQ